MKSLSFSILYQGYKITSNINTINCNSERKEKEDKEKKKKKQIRALWLH